MMVRATPAAISHGTALNATQLNATANVAGSFAYTPVAGTTLSAGNQTLSVTFTPTDSATYSSQSASVILSVTKAASILTWSAPVAISYGTALSATQLNAVANVPGVTSYTPVAGTILAAGSQTLSASFVPTDTVNYNGTTGSTTLTVNKAVPVITWNTPASIIQGAALTTTQLNAVANVAGSFAYSPAAGTVPALGNQPLSVTFTPTDGANYSTQTATVTLSVVAIISSISWVVAQLKAVMCSSATIGSESLSSLR